MGRYMLRRLLTALLTVALVTVLNFLLMRLAPGDPVQIIAGMNNPSAEQMAALTERYGLNKPLSEQLWIYIKQLAAISPETRVYSNMEPTMLYYDGENSGVNMAIGKDAAYYHQNCPNVMWNQDRQPYGYAGVRRLFEALTEAENRWEEQP